MNVLAEAERSENNQEQKERLGYNPDVWMNLDKIKELQRMDGK